MSETMNGPLSNLDENDSPADINQLKELDNFLKCGICYEYFNTCVMTNCSHNFCSLCIRKYIQYKTECPVCFAELYDSQLRANRIVDTFVGIFPQLKERIIRRIRTLKMLKPNCVYVSPSKSVEFKTPGARTPKKRHSLSTVSNTEIPAEDPAPVVVDEAPNKNLSLKINTPTSHSQNMVVIPKIFQSPVKKNSPVTPVQHTGTFVECPVCMVEIPQRNINSHLDDCLKRSNNCSKKQASSPVEKRAHLPKLVFRLMSMTALRAKAKEYGLNPQGDMDTVKTRIQKFTAMYNAECDKVDPRPVHDIIRQLDKEEKILAGQKFPKSLFSSQADNPGVKQELNALYLKEYKSSFDELIKSVKCRNSNESKEAVKTSLVVEPCQPSTSKAYDWFEVEDMKVEPVEPEPDGQVNPAVAADLKLAERNASNEDEQFVLPASKRKCKRSKRLDFDDCDAVHVAEAADPLFVNVEPSSSVFDALTDEDDVFSTNISPDPADRSPVLQKRTRRKRLPEEQLAVKQTLRKRKR